MPAKPGDFIWYELMTPDPVGAKAFYGAVVGWEFRLDDPAYGFIANGDGGLTGGVLRLTQEMLDGGARPGWLGYIAVADCDATLGAIEAGGGKLLMSPFEIAATGRMAMVADPGGAPFYVMEPAPERAGEESTAFSPTLPGRCSWNELLSTDPSAAFDFYTRLFGWSVDGEMDMGPMGKYRFLRHGEIIGALMGTTPDHPQSGWNHYFRVLSISEAQARIEANAGQVTMQPHQVPTGEWIVLGTDPQGAPFALVGGH